MNISRLSFLRRAIGTLAALPLVSLLLPRKAEAAKAPKISHVGVETQDFCLRGLQENPDAMLLAMTQAINESIQQCIRARPECCVFEIYYRNIRHSKFNPDGTMGFFRVLGHSVNPQAAKSVNVTFTRLPS